MIDGSAAKNRVLCLQRPVPSHLLLDKQSSTSLLQHTPLKPPVSRTVYPLCNPFFLRKCCPTLRHFPSAAHRPSICALTALNKCRPAAWDQSACEQQSYRPHPPQTSSTLALGRCRGCRGCSTRTCRPSLRHPCQACRGISGASGHCSLKITQSDTHAAPRLQSLKLTLEIASNRQPQQSAH